MGLAIRNGLVYIFAYGQSRPNKGPNQMSFTIECGKGIVFTVTDEMLIELGKHQEAFNHTLMIGLKNMVQDSHASIVREDFATDDEWKAAKRAKAELKLGAIIAGDIRVSRGESKPKVDDFTSMARKIVLSMLKPEKKKALAAMPDKGVATIDGLIEKNLEALRPKVEAALLEAARKEAEKAELSKGLDLDI